MTKNILITGATSGIGLETSRILASKDQNLFLVGRKFTQLQELILNEQLPNINQLKADLTINEEVDTILKDLPALNGIVLAAGVTKVQPFKFSTEADILNINSINYNSQLLLLKKLLTSKKIAPGASIVVISSISAIAGMKANSLYAGTKGALIAFSKSLALELAPQRIRINCLLPAVVQTRMVKDSIDPAHLAEHAKLYPLGLGDPSDVAHAIEFFLSEKSRWITGTTLVLDGGYSIS